MTDTDRGPGRAVKSRVLVHRTPAGLPSGLADITREERTLVMGVVNVTPDSFSDGGQHLDPDAAIAHGLKLRTDGADLVDVGGESTRPGAGRIDADEETQRVLPVVRGLVQAGVVVSIDTMRSSVAAAALDAGAALVNDVSGGSADAEMATLVADRRTPYVVMHWRGHSADMSSRADYSDVVSEVVDELRTRLDQLIGAGVDIDQVIVDPGLGFAKDAEHNWALLGSLNAFETLARPLLIGASRKSFLGRLLGAGDAEHRPVNDREHATTAISALAADAGAWAVRVHDARAARDAVEVVAAVRRSQSSPGTS